MNRTTNFKGKPMTLEGNEVKLGDSAPEFLVTGQDMADISSSSFAGKVLVLSLVPSIDTPVCAIETKRFNQEFEKIASASGSAATCLTVSMDLPFAQKRWCAAEGVQNVTLASDYKHRSLGKAYGAFIKELGLMSRAVFVIDKSGKVTHAQYVSEVTTEPDYTAVIQALTSALN